MSAHPVLDPETDLTRTYMQANMLPQGCLSPYALACCLHEALNRALLPPSVGSFQAVVEADEAFVSCMARLYPDRGPGETQDLSLDTAERGWLVNLMAREFVGCDWPTIGDGEEAFLAFLDRLETGMRLKGWEFRRHLVRRA